jgi:predicted secreted Zn-dependent protease
LDTARTGLGTLAQAAVICSVFAVVLLGMVVFAQRQEAIDAFAAGGGAAAAVVEPHATEAAIRATPTPAPIPPPDAGGPGTYTVQAGDSLFSVAEELGLSPNQLVYWNKDVYPTLQTTPALTPGWVLRTTGPPLPTPIPTPAPAQQTPQPQIAGTVDPGLGGVGPEAFPASASVTVTYYAVSGSTPSEVVDSMEANGPFSEWISERADASVETDASFNFRFRDSLGGCSVVLTADVPVTVTYLVTLPSWTPPAGVSQGTLDWWIGNLTETVAHEAHHIELYESYIAQMNEVVRTGTCEFVETEVTRLAAEARRVNCEFDVAEYGYAYGLTVDSCVTQ